MLELSDLELLTIQSALRFYKPPPGGEAAVDALFDRIHHYRMAQISWKRAMQRARADASAKVAAHCAKPRLDVAKLLFGGPS